MGANRSKTNSTELTATQIEILKEITKYSEFQILEWHDSFIKECPSGKIDREKFLQLYRIKFANGNADNYAEYVFNALDINSSGEIDFVEFLFCTSINLEGDKKEKLRMAFNLYDVDKNGKIDYREMEMLVTAIFEVYGGRASVMGSGPRDTTDKILSKLDKNRDGFITIDEFIEGCLSDDTLNNFFSPSLSL